MSRFMCFLLLFCAVHGLSYGQESEIQNEEEQILDLDITLEQSELALDQALKQLNGVLGEIEIDKEIHCDAVFDIKEIIPSKADMQKCLKQMEKAVEQIQKIDLKEVHKQMESIRHSLDDLKPFPRDI